MVAPAVTVDTERTHPFAKDAKGWGTRLVVTPRLFISGSSKSFERGRRNAAASFLFFVVLHYVWFFTTLCGPLELAGSGELGATGGIDHGEGVACGRMVPPAPAHLRIEEPSRSRAERLPG